MGVIVGGMFVLICFCHKCNFGVTVFKQGDGPTCLCGTMQVYHCLAIWTSYANWLSPSLAVVREQFTMYWKPFRTTIKWIPNPTVTNVFWITIIWTMSNPYYLLSLASFFMKSRISCELPRMWRFQSQWFHKCWINLPWLIKLLWRRQLNGVSTLVPLGK